MSAIRIATVVLMIAARPLSSLAQPAIPSSASTPPGPPSSQTSGGHEHHEPAAPPPPSSSGGEQPSTSYPLPANVPPLSDADRAAAFPDVEGHALHDSGVNYFVLFDQLEGLTAGGDTGGRWDNVGWIGGDVNRLWFRTEGEGDGDRLEEASADLLYGRAISRWWDVVGGIRQDFRPGPARTWAAIGLQGLAPYWFEVEATAYVGASGRTLFQLETEYELLLTNRLILQPRIEADIYGKSDPERGIGAGLSATEVGVRLRYELEREIAPYVGIVWKRRFFGTADFADATGEDSSDARLVFGVRLWR